MKRVKLVIADPDEVFARNLMRYLMVHHAGRFETCSFSKGECLKEYLLREQGNVDMLLYSEAFERTAIEDVFSGAEAVLTEYPPETGEDAYHSIYKYQHAEKLISDLLRIYTEAGRTAEVYSGKEGPITAAMLSAGGGCGKTALCVCCSAISSKRGKKTLYLNLEPVPGTSLFFKGSAKQSFSNVIYYLKENSGSLPAKIESAVCVDNDTAVRFFQPPPHLVDMEELSPEEAGRLLDCLKKSGGYDYIFVDTGCGMSQRNIEIFRRCDRLLHIGMHTCGSRGKDARLLGEYPLLKQKFNLDVAARSLIVSNMCNAPDSRGNCCPGNRTAGGEPDAVIGFYPGLDEFASSAYTGCSSFAGEAARILDLIAGSGAGVSRGFTEGAGYGE